MESGHFPNWPLIHVLKTWCPGRGAGERSRYPGFMILKRIGESLEKLTKMQIPGLQWQ